eukprot:scaffold64092_cov30-Tisochrysis_lutea.AAC.2
MLKFGTTLREKNQIGGYATNCESVPFGCISLLSLPSHPRSRLACAISGGAVPSKAQPAPVAIARRRTPEGMAQSSNNSRRGAWIARTARTPPGCILSPPGMCAAAAGTFPTGASSHAQAASRYPFHTRKTTSVRGSSSTTRPKVSEAAMYLRRGSGQRASKRLPPSRHQRTAADSPLMLASGSKRCATADAATDARSAPEFSAVPSAGAVGVTRSDTMDVNIERALVPKLEPRESTPPVRPPPPRGLVRVPLR